MENFYNACFKQGALAIPLFNKIEDGIFNVTGQYISAGLAKAIGQLLMPEDEEDAVLSADSRSLQLKEINLDDNGLKDEQFCTILEALNKQKFLNKVSYVNNELGEQSVKQITKLIGEDSENDVSDLRLTSIRCTKKNLYDLLHGISLAHHRLTKLRISSIEINDFVLMSKLNETIYNLP